MLVEGLREARVSIAKAGRHIGQQCGDRFFRHGVETLEQRADAAVAHDEGAKDDPAVVPFKPNRQPANGKIAGRGGFCGCIDLHQEVNHRL